jgi:hypothetical protein
MGPAFEPGFKILFPLMQRFLKPDKQAPTKGMAIGCFAEIVHWTTIKGSQQPQQHALSDYFPLLLQYSQASLQDPSPIVRRNGAYCAGCLLLVPHPTILQAYPSFFSLLRNVYMVPSGPVDPIAGVVNGSLKDEEYLGARDNACSAIAKMIVTAPQASGQSMGQLIEVLLDGLPLQVDFNEAKYVYPTLMGLYVSNSNDIAPHTGRVVSIFSQVFGNPDVDTVVQKDMIAFCKELVRQAP